MSNIVFPDIDKLKRQGVNKKDFSHKYLYKLIRISMVFILNIIQNRSVGYHHKKKMKQKSVFNKNLIIYIITFFLN
jgi:hypothetical protein